MPNTLARQLLMQFVPTAVAVVVVNAEEQALATWRSALRASLGLP